MIVTVFARRKVRLGATLVFVVLCALIWWWMNAQRWQTIDRLVRLQVAHDAELLQRDITVSVQAVHAIALRMADQTRQGHAPFAANAEFFMDIFPGARAVSFLDAQHRVAEIRPTSLSGAIGVDVAAISPDRRRALETARTQNIVTMSGALDTSTAEGKAFAVFFPIRQDGIYRGSISLFFVADIWLNHLLFRGTPDRFQSGFANRITLNGQPIVETDDFGTAPRPHTQSARAQILSSTFEITLAPRPPVLPGPELVVDPGAGQRRAGDRICRNYGLSDPR